MDSSSSFASALESPTHRALRLLYLLSSQSMSNLTELVDQVSLASASGPGTNTGLLSMSQNHLLRKMESTGRLGVDVDDITMSSDFDMHSFGLPELEDASVIESIVTATTTEPSLLMDEPGAFSSDNSIQALLDAFANSGTLPIFPNAVSLPSNTPETSLASGNSSVANIDVFNLAKMTDLLAAPELCISTSESEDYTNKKLWVIVKDQAMRLIGARKSQKKFKSRTMNEWILPHTPGPYSMPRFRWPDGQLCLEVDWKKSGKYDLNAEFIEAVVLAVQATGAKVTVGVEKNVIHQIAAKYFKTMKVNYIAQRKNKENIF
ncbi:hypothetical protein HWV62_16380 [Athelia sp. TMB]|nr:hypothetical protein HWV62_16380 [Athelia sp. TMB]